jgi:hypothetical protein
MKRIHSQQQKVRRERSWPEVLPRDPRDPDIVRAKAIDRSVDRRSRHDPGSRARTR